MGGGGRGRGVGDRENTATRKRHVQVRFVNLSDRSIFSVHCWNMSPAKVRSAFHEGI